MKYILEIEVADSEKLFAEKFFEKISFVKKVKAVVPNETNSDNAADETVDELNKIKSKRSITEFSGILSENDYQSLRTHTEQARKEWIRAI